VTSVGIHEEEKVKERADFNLVFGIYFQASGFYCPGGSGASGINSFDDGILQCHKLLDERS